MWCLIAAGDDRQYGGNTGYRDDPQRVYRYDSNVANYRQLKEDDLAIIRDKTSVVGAAQVRRIETERGTKHVRRCLECGTTAIKVRVRKTPAWRCNKGHEFDNPSEAEEDVTSYAAFFDDTFVALPDGPSILQLKAAALRPSDQVSIEELDLSKLEPLLSGNEAAIELIAQFLSNRTLESEEADQANNDDFVPLMADQREAALRAIKTRRGQSAFRKTLIRIYGPACMVTGCAILDLLEAAHIIPYRGESYNHAANGLLLRADIHTLFDLNLMWIEPGTLKVRFANKLLSTEYGRWEGQTINAKEHRPSVKCLELRRETCMKISGMHE